MCKFKPTAPAAHRSFVSEENKHNYISGYSIRSIPRMVHSNFWKTCFRWSRRWRTVLSFCRNRVTRKPRTVFSAPCA